jgi:hypothetical protein
MGDFSDPSGQWARFLWCFLPIRPAPYPDDAIHLDISDFLYGIYRRLAEFPPTTYRLGPAARDCYIHWYNELDRFRLAEVKQSLRAVYAKFKSDTGVLALLLHCLNAAIAGQPPTERISEATLRTAIQLSKFYLGQVKLIHSEGDALDGDLTPSFCKMLSLSQRKGWVTARDIYRARAVYDRKATLDQIRGLMRELVTMGLAIARNEGNRLEIQAINRGDSHPNTGDNSPKSGDNDINSGDTPQEFGDSLPEVGDTWSAKRDDFGILPVEPSLIGTVTSQRRSVTNNGGVVTTKPPSVTTLSPDRQSLEGLPGKRLTQNNTDFVTTSHKLHQPRPPIFERNKLQIGDLCRYRGPDGAMQVTCWGKDLQVLAIEAGTAKVKAEQWVHPHQIEVCYLRKIQ